MDRGAISAAGIVFFGAFLGVVLKFAGAPPNFEMLMPFVLSVAFAYGPMGGFVGGLAIRALYDVNLLWVGPWTVYTSIAYGVVGFLAGLYGLFMPKPFRKSVELVVIAITLTVVYDVITMVAFAASFGLLGYMQYVALAQVPFTLMHLLSNCLFSVMLTPALMEFINKQKMQSPVVSKGI